MRRFLPVLIGLGLTVGLSTPAFAAGTRGGGHAFVSQRASFTRTGRSFFDRDDRRFSDRDDRRFRDRDDRRFFDRRRDDRRFFDRDFFDVHSFAYPYYGYGFPYYGYAYPYYGLSAFSPSYASGARAPYYSCKGNPQQCYSYSYFPCGEIY